MSNYIQVPQTNTSPQINVSIKNIISKSNLNKSQKLDLILRKLLKTVIEIESPGYSNAQKNKNYKIMYDSIKTKSQKSIVDILNSYSFNERNNILQFIYNRSNIQKLINSNDVDSHDKFVLLYDRIINKIISPTKISYPPNKHSINIQKNFYLVSIYKILEGFDIKKKIWFILHFYKEKDKKHIINFCNAHNGPKRGLREGNVVSYIGLPDTEKIKTINQSTGKITFETGSNGNAKNYKLKLKSDRKIIYELKEFFRIHILPKIKVNPGFKKNKFQKSSLPSPLNSISEEINGESNNNLNNNFTNESFGFTSNEESSENAANQSEKNRLKKERNIKKEILGFYSLKQDPKYQAILKKNNININISTQLRYYPVMKSNVQKEFATYLVRLKYNDLTSNEIIKMKNRLEVLKKRTSNNYDIGEK